MRQLTFLASGILSGLIGCKGPFLASCRRRHRSAMADINVEFSRPDPARLSSRVVPALGPPVLSDGEVAESRDRQRVPACDEACGQPRPPGKLAQSERRKFTKAC
jgi:hypothetical protein